MTNGTDSMTMRKPKEATQLLRVINLLGILRLQNSDPIGWIGRAEP
jgi:hypothetical protein